jgi:hypothetical protein
MIAKSVTTIAYGTLFSAIGRLHLANFEDFPSSALAALAPKRASSSGSTFDQALGRAAKEKRR